MEAKRNKLKSMLKEIWDDDDFITGTDLDLKTEEDVDKVIKYIESGKWKTTDDIEWFIIKEINKLVK